MVIVSSYKVGRREAEKVPDRQLFIALASKCNARKGECLRTRNDSKLRQRS